MIRILILLLSLYGHLYALDRGSTLKIYHKVFSALSSKTTVSVYVNDNEYRKVFSTSKRIRLAKDPRNADIALITNVTTLNKVLAQKRGRQAGAAPLLFTTNYRLLKRSNAIIGAFYWRKGRPQLLFIGNRLGKHHIVLPKEYHHYIIDTL